MSFEATRIGIACLLRARSIERMPRPVLAAMGVLAAGAVVALLHLAGIDVRGGFPAGQSGLLPGMIRADSSQQA